ncbi:MAG: hypothetical protein DRG78_15760 [Epsilonproteobacteria bacterium]|nr:MAG: hypothetical protein DRG78_15760 [Campylobacterota bacterium]
MKRTLIAHSPDADDIFMYYAIKFGWVDMKNTLFDNIAKEIQTLNEDALNGVYDIVAISFALYPHIKEDYAPLRTAVSFGEGYGPKLIKKKGVKLKRNFKVASLYGYGLWDYKWSISVKEPVNLAKEAGIQIFRLIGMWKNWKDGIKNLNKERKFEFGVDEQMKICSEIGADKIICIPYIFEPPQNVSNLLSYLNRKADEKLYRELLEGKDEKRLLNKYVRKGRKINWANLRAINGHFLPYNAKYFEIGNETYLVFSPQEYAYQYLTYYHAMKSIDPTIKIGVVLYKKEWNQAILKIIKDKIDFGIVHIYPTPVWGERLGKIPAKDIFSITLALPEFQYQKYIKETLEILRKYAKKDVPLAVTEFNCGFVQDEPVPYRHTLGCALVNAELLKIFMRPENKILMANYWNFINEYWGMIANGFHGDYKDLYKPYYKRPNYYVFELYHKHFGEVLLDVKVECGGYNLGDFEDYLGERYFDNLEGETISGNLLKSKKWQVREVPRSKVKSISGVLDIEFDNPQDTNYYHTYKVCEVEPDTYYKLSGYIKAENLQVSDEEAGFRLEVQDVRGWTKTKWAKSTKDVKGSTDWVYVEKIFKTLPDAKAIKVIARRIGEKQPLKGRVLVKNVCLVKIKAEDYRIPYLSVNASKSKDEKKVYLMVINKNLEKEVEAEIRLKGFETKTGVAKIFILWAKRIDATNEGFFPKVKVYKEEVKFKGNSFRYKFKKHSLTAIEISGGRKRSVKEY